MSATVATDNKTYALTTPNPLFLTGFPTVYVKYINNSTILKARCLVAYLELIWDTLEERGLLHGREMTRLVEPIGLAYDIERELTQAATTDRNAVHRA